MTFLNSIKQLIVSKYTILTNLVSFIESLSQKKRYLLLQTLIISIS